jgi:hypothetical protein
MQPYFLPYIGYWQLINAVDVFVVYDNIQYTKKGYINRNRILVDGEVRKFSIPLKSDSHILNINERIISESFENEKYSLLKRIDYAYHKAPNFEEVYHLVESIVLCNESNLFQYIYSSIKLIVDYLDIDTRIIISSDIPVNHELKGRERLIEICKNLNAENYINPIGGIKLYSKEDFRSENITIKFLETKPLIYRQFNEEFISDLSIIDVLMFNSKSEVKKMLNSFKLR